LQNDQEDESVTDFEGRRAEARADYEQRLITGKEYQATLDQIDADEDSYLRRRDADGPAADPASADTAAVRRSGPTPR
jgi:hypothetical protein